MVLTKELCEEYRNRVEEIGRLNKRLEYYAEHPVPSEHGVVMSSMKDFPYARTHLVISGSDVKSDEEYINKVRQLVVTISTKKRDCEYLKGLIDDGLSEMEDGRTKTVLVEKYLNGRTDREIAEMLGLERSSVTKILKNVV